MAETKQDSEKPVPVPVELLARGREIPPYPYGDDATFLVRLPPPKNPTGGPIIRGSRTGTTIRSGDGKHVYRASRGEWKKYAVKTDGEGRQLYQFMRDPAARPISEIHEERKVFHEKKSKEAAESKARAEAVEREEAERKFRIEAEAKAKVEAEMKAEEAAKPRKVAAEEDFVDEDVDEEDLDLDLEPAPRPKKRPVKKKAAKKKASTKRS